MIRSFACACLFALSVACEASAPGGPAASPSTEHAMLTGDPCVDAQTYQRRAKAADEPVRSALQRIADSKSRQCAAGGVEKTAKAEPK